ncbi:nitrate reductase cytochrome c-type subunit [Halomonas sp. M1]|uniref:nitrate reductase cytochrome c-type subunit n=1 Tax=Halomonas sp. M1 TaxID=3035470 RepID=UPI002485EFCA|nr:MULTISPECIES: nitrate reductase cytochrome c-type subunit [unclassified Halomonas]MDP3536650.1 nitrate reductase cytochrome c-type subunit [Halomonas sp.]WFE70280.1 nitrate reductase cytochrome c-type subunit [Halomonas sp. M1]
MKWLFPLCLSMALLAGAAGADETRDAPAPDGLRLGGTISQTQSAAPIAGEPRDSGREVRSYPEQPPVIPHAIRDYQVDMRVNQCLNCHSREQAVSAGAPMVSITHFMDRHKQVLAAVSPDRYFCTQCHVPKTDATPLVPNRFKSVEEVINEALRERQEAGQ